MDAIDQLLNALANLASHEGPNSVTRYEYRAITLRGLECLIKLDQFHDQAANYRAVIYWSKIVDHLPMTDECILPVAKK